MDSWEGVFHEQDHLPLISGMEEEARRQDRGRGGTDSRRRGGPAGPFVPGGSGGLDGGLSAQQIKLIAVIAMVGDHLAWWLLPAASPLGALLHLFGRITAPVICFFVAEGCYHTSHLGRYFLRLLLCALPSHFAYVFYFRRGLWETASVIWGLLWGLAALSLWRRWVGPPASPAAARRRRGGDAAALAGAMGGAALSCLAAAKGDWSCTAVLWILTFGIFHGQFAKQMLALSAVGLVCYLLPAWSRAGGPVGYTLGIFLAIPLLALYNGERSSPGKRGAVSGPCRQSRAALWGKWGFYLFYPLHLFVLGVLRNWAFPG